MKFHFSNLASVLLAIATQVQADECTPNTVGMNVCEYARTVAEKMAPSLPMRLSANMRLMSVFAAGPRMSASAVWEMDKSTLDTNLSASSMTIQSLKDKMNAYTKNFACSSEELKAFVHLGGEVQYNYSTTDGFLIASIPITECP